MNPQLQKLSTLLSLGAYHQVLCWGDIIFIHTYIHCYSVNSRTVIWWSFPSKIYIIITDDPCLSIISLLTHFVVKSTEEASTCLDCRAFKSYKVAYSHNLLQLLVNNVLLQPFTKWVEAMCCAVEAMCCAVEAMCCTSLFTATYIGMVVWMYM